MQAGSEIEDLSPIGFLFLHSRSGGVEWKVIINTPFNPMSRSFFLAIPLFFLLILSILYFSHYFLYCSILHFFGISGAGRKTALVLILFLLPTSFIASSLVARWIDDRVSRVLYFTSALWLGVGLTLMVAFALAWAAWGAVKLFTHSPSPVVFGFAAVVLACLYSGYGVWNAYHPRTEDVSVRIKNLPPEWRGKKIVQLSDVHLGRVLGSAFLQGLVEKINAENPSIVFITGDLFDGADGRLDDLVSPLNEIRAPLGIYYVTGNHETYLGTDRAYAALRKTKTRILADEMVVINGLQIIGISYAQRGFSKDIAEVIRKLPDFNPRMASVLLYHSPTQIAQAKAAGISLQLSGHTHKGQIFPIQFISRLIFQKYYNGLHVEGDYAIYTSSGAGTWGPTMRTGNHPEIAVIHLE
jgi:predicted MPP superfamily phosphohydrolase